jgi:hypothetical protein
LSALRGPLPSAEQAEGELRAGIERQDSERAERAIVALVRGSGMGRVMQPLWHYAGRDFTFIGHKAIWVAGVYQLLQAVGWEHAEAQLRFVVQDLARHDEGMLEPYPVNVDRVKKSLATFPAGWSRSGEQLAITAEIVDLIRNCQGDAACDLAVASLQEGKATAGAVWDAVFLAAGEQTMNTNQASGAPLHATTGVNALRFAYGATADEQDRLLLLLQAVSWTVRYRNGNLGSPVSITNLAPEEILSSGDEAAEEIVAMLTAGGDASRGPVVYREQPQRLDAARKALRFGEQYPGDELLFRRALRLLPAKAGWDVHQIKFPVAMLQNYRWISPAWRRHYLAQSTYSFLGSGLPDTALIQQVRAALAGG